MNNYIVHVAITLLLHVTLYDYIYDSLFPSMQYIHYPIMCKINHLHEPLNNKGEMYLSLLSGWM